MSSHATHDVADAGNQHQHQQRPQSVGFSLYYHDRLVDIDPLAAWLAVPRHLTAARLSRKLKLLGGIPAETKVHVYRYSRVADSYVLLDSPSEYLAMMRAVKVKRHLTFCLKEDDGSCPRMAIRCQNPATRLSQVAAAPMDTFDAPGATGAVAGGAGAVANAASPSVATAGPETGASTAGLSSLLQSEDIQAVIREVAQALRAEFLQATTKEVPSTEQLAADLEHLTVTEQQPAAASDDASKAATTTAVTENNKEVKEEEELSCCLGPATPYYHDATCDACHRWIANCRYKCLWCSDYDLCSDCFTKVDSHHPNHTFVRVSSREDIIRPNLFRMGVHKDILCDGPCCIENSSFIYGDRYTCTVCPNMDFCGKCMSQTVWKHDPSHTMMLRRSPMSDPKLMDTVNDVNPTSNQDDVLKDYCAELQSFRYACEANSRLTWVLKNVGLKTWPIGTVMRPACELDSDASVTRPYLDHDVPPGETITLEATWNLARDASRFIADCDYASWRLETISGVQFAHYKYYHGMKIEKPIVLPGTSEATETEAEATTEEPTSVDESDKPTTDFEDEATEEKVADAETATLRGDESEVQEATNDSTTPEPTAEMAITSEDAVLCQKGVSTELESSQVRLFEIPRESPSPAGSQLFPDGSSLNSPVLMAARPTCRLPRNPGLKYDVQSESDVFSDGDSIDDVGDDYDVVNASDLSDLEG